LFQSLTNSRNPRLTISFANSFGPVLFKNDPFPSTRTQTVRLAVPTRMEGCAVTWLELVATPALLCRAIFARRTDHTADEQKNHVHSVPKKGLGKAHDPAVLDQESAPG